MNDRDGVRTIDAGAPPARFARGWHCLGLAEPVPRLRPARGARRSAPSWWCSPTRRAPARARRVLPAHGRRPEPGHGQGRRDRLPVPRLALGRRRPVRADPLRPAGPARGPDPVLADAGAERAAVRLARPAAQPAARARDHPPDRGRVLRRVERLDLGLDPGRGGQLPRGGRQRRGHGAFLLHPLRLPDVLQERARGAHRLAVPADQGAAGYRERLELRVGNGHHAALRGLLLRAVLHDRQAVARLPRHRPWRAS